MPAPTRKIPLLLAAVVLLALGVILVLLLRREQDEPGPRPNRLLAALGTEPSWPELRKYDRVLTRAEFEEALREVYLLGDNWHCTLTDEAVTIHSQLQPEGQRVEFAPAQDRKAAPPRYWRPVHELAPAPEDQPLSGLKIAIDPGHLGGEWARMEERWYRIGETRPVMEGSMTLQTAKLLKPRLEQLGANVTLVRKETEPVTSKRPADFLDYAAEKIRGAPEAEVQKLAEKLFYRTAEIRARAKLVNETIQPDLLLCLHFNAEAWGDDPTDPRFSPRNHFHMILHGAYMEGEIAHEDERFEMMHKVFQGVHAEEAALAEELVRSFTRETRLPAYLYALGKPTIRIGPAMWARNLLANRLYQCPVLFFEPYVMNNKEVYERVQAGDYEGEREVAGRYRKSLYREYVDAVVGGLVDYYKPRRKSVQ